MKEVILIFDVGKTNKKVILFDRSLKVVHEEESIFKETVDDDGFPCDDAHLLEQWIKDSIVKFLKHETYLLKGINFTTYGATLVCLDKEGNRLTPIYNYLKPLPEEVPGDFYDRYDGLNEFSRKTASPELGMLNSGLQLLWLKRMKPEVFSRIEQVLHLPQYLSYLIHGQVVSEHTSIGCHTMMWDFDRMGYHLWLEEEEIALPQPVPVSETFPVVQEGCRLEVGVGIHDSSSSLAPYIRTAKETFILVSTGTWCISMNPFNEEVLTTDELNQDCLCFLGVHGKPVKSSRFFLGRIHDLNVERLQEHFFTDSEAFKRIEPTWEAIEDLWESGKEHQLFFRKGVPEGLVDLGVDCRQFNTFDEAYTRLMVDLSRLAVKAIGLVMGGQDNTLHLYISGGFAKNPFFMAVLSLAFPNKQMFTSEVNNASALGAALVIADKIWIGAMAELDLGLTSPVPQRPLQ